MFTGLVEQVGRLEAVRTSGADAELRVGCRLEGLVPGESIAVDGVCLTASTVLPSGFVATASSETLGRTTLGTASSGQQVHLERALPIGGRLGGHLVTGHVDATTRVLGRRELGQGLEVTFELPAPVSRLVAEKGSVALDGVSLTVNTVSAGKFSVLLVPYTRGATHLDRKPVGALVNLEADVIAKYTARLLGVGGVGEGDGVTLELLEKHGFVR